jgi:cell wall-associated NlpC family hydrolase
MTPEFWTARLPDADRVLADPASIALQNARLRSIDPAVHSLEALPTTLDRSRVLAWVEGLSRPPAPVLYDGHGAEITAEEMRGLTESLALHAIPASQPTRFGLVTHRASLRRFPTLRQAFKRRDERELDRFQESAFFPGTPVAVVHADSTGGWVFVVGEFYSAWIPAEAVATGERATVLDYARRDPCLIVTGAQIRTAHTNELPAVSELVLDMGVRVPRIEHWPTDRAVNGQLPGDGQVIELPLRGSAGELHIVPALLPAGADVNAAPLDYTRSVLIHQAFKFLGERYGWGHAHGARDCSGFVSEVYRSVGIELPRNSRDQAASEAFDRLAFEPGTKHSARVAALKRLQAGDLVFVPGHVMMVLGQTREGPWVIHDTHQPRMKSSDGVLRPLPANGVVVTPLLPLHFGDDGDLVDAVTAIQRIRPRSAA